MGTDLDLPPGWSEDTTVSTRVRDAMSRLTPAERKVAHILLASYPMAGMDTVAGFAERAQTSGPTILRFISKLGFDSYNAFQRSLRAELERTLDSPLSRYDHQPRAGEDTDRLTDFSDALCGNVARVFEHLPRSEFAAIVELLCDEARTIYCLGGRFSRTIAMYLNQYLRQLRRGAVLIDGPNDIWTEHLLEIGRKDVLVVFDFRRYQPDVVQFAQQVAARGATLVLVTDVWHSPIAPHAKHIVGCPVTVPTAFDSGLAGLAVAEAVVAGMVERLGARGRERMERLDTIRGGLASQDDASARSRSGR